MVQVTLPQGQGGWWHDYVCPVHGVELGHAGLLSGAFPAEGAPCVYGCSLDTPKVRGAWTVLAHQTCGRRILELAESLDPADNDAALGLLTQYARLYAALPAAHEGAQAWMLRGRLFQQALTEAIWAVTIGRASWLLADRGLGLGPEVGELLTSLAGAAEEARAALVEDRFTSNYVAWFCAAGAVCSRDPEWLEGQHGLYNHLLAATSPDGWQWEASTYYHSFVLRAALLAIAAVPGANPPSDVRDRLASMADVLATLRTAGGLLPALHDGPYGRPGFDDELAELAKLISGTPRPAGVTVFRDAGYAVLRGAGLHAIVDFGPHGGSHGHRDKLALYLYGATSAWQPDPGQVPYGHAGWRRYYASAAAHPTFSVDGMEQAECSGRLVDVSERSVTVECTDAFPGVVAQRRLTLTDDGLLDELTIAAARPCRLTAHLRPAVPVEVRPGSTRWGGDQVLVGEHSCDVPAEFAARPGPGPADDPQRVVTHIDWTAYDAAKATFRSRYRVED
ncbi:MAG TPA: heparinase II/III family protein [Kribbella sp.]|uniref:heparinase II/III domain-containing protein n=1 Tax=Kribbella sp. TaxID=1871183 RepID=UPI002D769B7A|nr:heparinase II/III family protein [Kribbella sp.]HET6297432.1 heparinase II/III family protein [Kribbella sp.]